MWLYWYYCLSVWFLSGCIDSSYPCMCPAAACLKICGHTGCLLWSGYIVMNCDVLNHDVYHVGCCLVNLRGHCPMTLKSVMDLCPFRTKHGRKSLSPVSITCQHSDHWVVHTFINTPGWSILPLSSLGTALCSGSENVLTRNHTVEVWIASCSSVWISTLADSSPVTPFDRHT